MTHQTPQSFQGLGFCRKKLPDVTHLLESETKSTKHQVNEMTLQP